MTELSSKKCQSCSGGVSALDPTEVNRLLKQLNGDWEVKENHQIEREIKFKNFKQALDFTNRVGDIAEQQGHHPDIFLTWGKVKVTLWTHKADGLTENDFILAAKIDQLV